MVRLKAKIIDNFKEDFNNIKYIASMTLKNMA
jgi:hypothetical protein